MPMHHLRNTDCFEYMKTMPAECVDLVLTDPPYGMDFQSNKRREKHRKIENDAHLEWLPDFVSELARITKPNAHIYSFCSWHKVDEFKRAFEKHFTIKNILVWAKPGGGMGDLAGGYGGVHEFIFFINRGKPLNGKRAMDVITKAYRTGNKLHPTQKPVNLMEFFIEKSTAPGELVFDPFMGSGATAIAAANTDRRFVGCEIDPEYFELTEKRLAEAMAQTRLF